MYPFNWSAIEDEAVNLLCDLIRIDTTNPPGNESAAAEYLLQIYEREGIEAKVVEPEKGRGSIVARLKGQADARPLILHSHLDVVPASGDEWSVPPFREW